MVAGPREQVKLAIIGCGAVVQEMYLPAVDLVPSLAVTHIVDLDIERAREAACRFQIPNPVDDYRKVYGQVDAVVVATPPRSHARISIDCLNQKLPVLCEKPLAVSVEEAETMISASQRAQTPLAVGMVRRLSWSSQLLRRLVQVGILGDIRRFDVEEGHKFNWPLRTGHIFQSRQGGGVLADTGTHLLDLLLWTLGSQRTQLSSYKDDNWGGVEMNAVVELAMESCARLVPGRIELSFTRKLRNTVRIHGDRGYLEAPVLGGHKVLFYPCDDDAHHPIVLEPHSAEPRKGVEEFALQLSNFADAIVDGSSDCVAADEALPVISTIEQCYRTRELLVQPWEIKHLESFFEGKVNE